MAHHGTDDPAEKFVTRLLVHHFPSHLCYLSGSVFHPPSKHSENPFLHLQADVLQELLILLQPQDLGLLFQKAYPVILFFSPPKRQLSILNIRLLLPVYLDLEKFGCLVSKQTSAL